MRITGVSPIPTYAFFSRLNIYAAALISHFVNLRMLHSRHARHSLQSINPSSPVKLPSILMRLSELLPSKNKSARTQKPWAKDSVKLTFQGLEPGSPEEFVPTVHPIEAPQSSLVKAKAKAVRPANMPLPGTPTVASPAAAPPSVTQLPPVDTPKQFGPGEGVVVITEARMTVPVPKALTILKERVDRDIAFDAKSGTFAFRLRSKVGETVIPAFIERAIRVERLVDFVEVLHKHEKTLKCEYISLGRIVFTYGNTSSVDTMDVDGTLKGYKATVDFGATNSLMTLIFEQGNPHLRIADNLAKVLNEKQGLDGVATLLPLTLPALRALDTLEGAWTPLAGKGEPYVFVRAVEWYIIRYNIPSSDQARPRKIMFEIRLQQRRGEAWWYVRRIDTRDREGDDVDATLKPVWNSKGPGWQGMRVSAVAQPSGVEELLAKLDEVMQNFASGNIIPEPIPASAPAQVKPPQRAPEAPMMQPQRQQPTPNQSQSQTQGRSTPQSQGRNTPNQSQGQSQGRVNTIKREIVEID
jgi:mediator of RNA polymerase II transcription subunit 14